MIYSAGGRLTHTLFKFSVSDTYSSGIHPYGTCQGSGTPTIFPRTGQLRSSQPPRTVQWLFRSSPQMNSPSSHGRLGNMMPKDRHDITLSHPSENSSLDPCRSRRLTCLHPVHLIIGLLDSYCTPHFHLDKPTYCPESGTNPQTITIA